MVNFIKVGFFLVVIAGIAIYFLSNPPEFLKNQDLGRFFVLGSKSTSTVPKTTPPYISSPKTTPTPQIPDYLIPPGFTRDQLSPYFGQVKISSAYASYFGGGPSQIGVSAYPPDGKKVDVTGWQIRGNQGGIIIPQAVNVYDPSGFGLASDIVLSSGNYLNIYGNTSPIARNFRLNKCTGYLNNVYTFNPVLPNNCPSVPGSKIIYLPSQCQSYISSIGSCKEPDPNISALLFRYEQACQNILSTLNYNSCFNTYRNDRDFLSNEWRIWVNQNMLDPVHDWVRLFDKNGLLVNMYSY